MSSIGCATFFAKSGWHCQTVNARGSIVSYISTPIVLAGGKPLDFYLIPMGEFVEFTDDGMTMFALRTLGYKLGDKRNWRGLELIAQRFGFNLSDNGAFETKFLERDLEQWGAKIIRLFATIATWEEDRSAEGDTDFSLTDEVAMLLSAKNPDLSLERNVGIGLGSANVNFDFKWGNKYIDAIRPIQQTVNSRLRKALLVGREDEGIELLFIVDDRQQSAKADEEISVLAAVAPTIRLTDFESHYSTTAH